MRAEGREHERIRTVRLTERWRVRGGIIYSRAVSSTDGACEARSSVREQVHVQMRRSRRGRLTVRLAAMRSRGSGFGRAVGPSGELRASLPLPLDVLLERAQRLLHLPSCAHRSRGRESPRKRAGATRLDGTRGCESRQRAVAVRAGSEQRRRVSHPSEAASSGEASRIRASECGGRGFDLPSISLRSPLTTTYVEDDDVGHA